MKKHVVEMYQIHKRKIQMKCYVKYTIFKGLRFINFTVSPIKGVASHAGMRADPVCVTVHVGSSLTV